MRASPVLLAALLLLGGCGRERASSRVAFPHVRGEFYQPRLLADRLMREVRCDAVRIDGWRLTARCQGATIELEQTPGQLRYSCAGVPDAQCIALVDRAIGNDLGSALDEDNWSEGDHIMEDDWGTIEGEPATGPATNMVDDGDDYFVFRGKSIPEGAQVRLLEIGRADELWARRSQLLGAECNVITLEQQGDWFSGHLDCGVLIHPSKVKVDLTGELVRITEVDEEDDFFVDRDTLIGKQCVRGPTRAVDGDWLRAELYCDGAYLQFDKVKVESLGRI
jgi:hypothetical protein